MVSPAFPLGQILSEISNKSLSANSKLNEFVENFIDLISIKVNRYGVSEAYKFLERSIYELRSLIMSDIDLMSGILAEYDSILNKKTTSREGLKPALIELDHYSNNALLIATKLSSDLLKEASEFFKFEDIQNPPAGVLEIPKYDDLFKVLNSIPGEEAPVVKEFISQSLTTDYFLIISEMIFNGVIRLKTSDIKMLCKSIKDTTEAYAINANRLGLWSPEENDETPWIRNIKIRISVEDRIYNYQSLEDLSSTNLVTSSF